MLRITAFKNTLYHVQIYMYEFIKAEYFNYSYNFKEMFWGKIKLMLTDEKQWNEL